VKNAFAGAVVIAVAGAVVIAVAVAFAVVIARDSRVFSQTRVRYPVSFVPCH
jgi:hypothetical protein